MDDAGAGVFLAWCLPLFAAGCATVGGHRQVADSCRAAPGQRYVGTKSDESIGAEVMKATRARELRWFAPPQTIITTEYRFGRVTVDLDENGIITRIACG